jgi:putative transcriptional regulator
MKNSILKLKQPEIGRLIKEIRQATGLTQEQFAAELGVVLPTINRWENGRSQPSPMALNLIDLKLKELSSKGEPSLRNFF